MTRAMRGFDLSDAISSFWCTLHARVVAIADRGPTREGTSQTRKQTAASVVALQAQVVAVAVA